jgi:hypothetical protein
VGEDLLEGLAAKGHFGDVFAARVAERAAELRAQADPPGPYLHVRVSLRTPGGLEASLDYDAEDAAGGLEHQKLVALRLTPSADGINARDTLRLKRLLECGAPSLGYAWGLVVKADKDAEEDA